MNRLYLVEGIPGAGKTTTARKLKCELEAQGYLVDLYEEGMLHPADCSWQAFLSEQEYNAFKEQCRNMWEASGQAITWEEVENCIEAQVRREEDALVLAYTKIQFPQEQYWSLIGTVAEKELCDGRSSLQKFQGVHLKRWRRFAKEAVSSNHITIFECAFLQNHIFELLGVYEKTDKEIKTWLSELINTVSGLNPVIIYLEPDSVEKVIVQAAAERRAQNPSRKAWIDEIADWISRSNYGRHHGLKGMQGVVEFLNERHRLDKLVLERLQLPVNYIPRNDTGKPQGAILQKA